jgi:hypothetical protein
VPRGSPTLSVVFSCPTEDGKYAAAHIHGPATLAVFYAVSKDGKYAGGSMYAGGKMAVHDGESARIVARDPLFEK